MFAEPRAAPAELQRELLFIHTELQDDTREFGDFLPTAAEPNRFQRHRSKHDTGTPCLFIFRDGNLQLLRCCRRFRKKKKFSKRRKICRVSAAPSPLALQTQSRRWRHSLFIRLHSSRAPCAMLSECDLNRIKRAARVQVRRRADISVSLSLELQRLGGLAD